MGSRIVHPPNILTLWACVCALSQCVRDSMSFTARVRRIPLRVGFDFSFFSSDEILSVRASDRVGPVGGLTFRVRRRIFSAAANRITRYSFLKKKMIRLGYFFNQPITMKKKIRFFTSSEVRGVFFTKKILRTRLQMSKKKIVSVSWFYCFVDKILHCKSVPILNINESVGNAHSSPWGGGKRSEIVRLFLKSSPDQRNEKNFGLSFHTDRVTQGKRVIF